MTAYRVVGRRMGNKRLIGLSGLKSKLNSFQLIRFEKKTTGLLTNWPSQVDRYQKYRLIFAAAR